MLASNDLTGQASVQLMTLSALRLLTGPELSWTSVGEIVKNKGAAGGSVYVSWTRRISSTTSGNLQQLPIPRVVRRRMANGLSNCRPS